MSNTATFTIDEAFVTPGEDIPLLTEEQVVIGVRSGVAEVMIPLQRTEFADEQAQAIAEALQGQEVTGTDQLQTGPDGEAYYRRAFADAVHKAIEEKIGEQT